MERTLSTPIGEYMRQLAMQGKGEGRLVMHDELGQPVAALVLFRADVAQKLQHLETFEAREPTNFSITLQ